MDLIYTNSKRVDQGVLTAYSFDMSFGASENDFEMKVGVEEPTLDFGAFAYFEGTEYGGIVDARKTGTDEDTVTYYGRTWHGMMNSKVIEPDAGADYLIVSGEANEVIAQLVERLGLGDLFVASTAQSGVTIKNYQFHRYCLGYEGICDMLADNGGKLKLIWVDRAVVLSAEPIVDYTNYPIDDDIAALTVAQYGKKTNHLICLGQGELAAREVIHLYIDQFGRVGDTQYYKGLDEITAVYDNSNPESSEELRKEGIKQLKEMIDIDSADISILEDADLTYDIGDIVGASDLRSGVTVTAKVTQKIVRINNGVVSTDYKTGG